MTDGRVNMAAREIVSLIMLKYENGSTKMDKNVKMGWQSNLPRPSYLTSYATLSLSILRSIS